MRASGPVAVVDVLAMGRPDRIDETAEMGVIADDAQRGLVGHRDVEGRLGVVADVAALEHVDAAFDRSLDAVESAAGW